MYNRIKSTNNSFLVLILDRNRVYLAFLRGDNMRKENVRCPMCGTMNYDVPTNYLIRREPILRHLSFDISTMRSIYVIRYYCPFPDTIPFRRAGCSRVTHPSATKHKNRSLSASFDLHVLGTPPAFILSQDQTLMLMFVDPVLD